MIYYAKVEYQFQIIPTLLFSSLSFFQRSLKVEFLEFGNIVFSNKYVHFLAEKKKNAGKYLVLANRDGHKYLISLVEFRITF